MTSVEFISQRQKQEARDSAAALYYAGFVSVISLAVLANAWGFV